MKKKFRPTKRAGDYLRTFSSEDGKHYRGEHQNMEPVMKRVELIKQAQAERGTGQFDRRYVGSIPKTILIDWLTKHGYKMDEFARNEGGDPYKTNPHGGSGVKDKFLKYFLSRDFAKLHTQHTTTRRESGQIVVPTNYIGGDNGTQELRRTEDGSR